MKIAIHNGGGFSERWIAYCKGHNIPYKLVNAYDTNIIESVKDCDAFLWHFKHYDYRDVLFAKELLYSLQIAGKKVFPDFNTCWHFDDKVGQKYLLESIEAPIVPSYVFYTKKEALKWIALTTFPKVFKLRSGAGSSNVKLIHSKKEARKQVEKAFGNGFPQFDKWSRFMDRLNKWFVGLDTFTGVCKGFGRLFISTEFSKMKGSEKGYVYFQDFIPHNNYDIRVIIINNRAFAIKRECRKNDFRASGSGLIIYEKEQINEECIKTAFIVNKKIKSSCIAFDFIFDEKDSPLIVEISYGFTAKGYDSCEGYWDSQLKWHSVKGFDFCGWMIEGIFK